MITATDPITLLAAMTGEQIRNRLRDLEAERKALHVLLRSVAARERAAARRASAPDHPQEVQAPIAV